MVVLSARALTGPLRARAVVVGSGFAGIAAARRIAAAGHSVVILESGNWDDVDRHWSIQTSGFLEADYGIPEPYKELHIRRQFGGGSAVWGGWCAVPRETTFEERGIGNGYGWPLAYHSLVPYLRDAIDFLRVSYEGDLLTADDEGPCSFPRFGFSPPVQMYDFEDELRSSSLITMVTDATVTELVEEQGGLISAVRIAELDETASVAGDVVVLAGGAVGNARLLARLSGNSAMTASARANVGVWLHEHPTKYSAFHCILKPEIARAVHARGPNDGGFVSMSPPPGLVRWNRWMDFNFQLWPVNPDAVPEAMALMENYSAIYDHEPVLYRASLAMEQLPDRDHMVISNEVISGVVDGDIKLSFDGHPAAIAEAATEWFGKEIAFSMVEPVMPSPIVAVGHMLGTTRMSNSDEYGVVSDKTKVFGLENVYCAGSSIFPSSGFANPTLTLVAMSLRTADLITRELGNE